jgi:hypothetical protein
MSSVPTPSIYLRNRFTIKGSRSTDFLAGKEQLLRSTQAQWQLIAGCGERSLRLGQQPPEPSLSMMHVWELDSWTSLYDNMYELSEAKWYRELGDTVASENQQLLVNFASGYGIARRRPWQSDHTPGYRYVYEELLLSRSTTMHAYLKELNWLSAELSKLDMLRTWCARQITGQPGLICLLWRCPDGLDIDATYDHLAEQSNSSRRYASMMRGIAQLEREVLQPMYTERLDERIRAGESAPIVQRISGPTTDLSRPSHGTKGDLNGFIHASS